MMRGMGNPARIFLEVDVSDIIESAEHLHAELIRETQGLTSDAIAARLSSKGDRLRTLAALYRCYDRAVLSAHKFGFTGFRRMTYAERRITEMQLRLKGG